MSQTVPPILSVLPSRALVDQKFKVVVENLPPGSPVTLHSLHHSEENDFWEAFGHYISDHGGTVCVAEDLSFGGTYTGKEPMGLLWSMRPVPGSRKGLRLRKRDVCSPMLVKVSVYSGHVAEGFMEQAPLASVLIERLYMAPGVQRIDIREKGVRGTLFIPTGPGPFPGLLDMWGGGGGLFEYRSALLASRGYVSFALEYFAPGEQRSADVELNLFETAFCILKDHPQVIPEKIGLLGLSLGSTVTMYLAAESTVIKPHCCVCVSSSHGYPRGGPLRGVFELMLKNSHIMRVDENNYQIWRDVGLGLTSDLSKKVDVGKINCPMLLVNGEDDHVWATVECAEDIAQMMQAAGKEHLLTRVQYPNTGHLIEPPYSPHFRASTFFIHHTKQKVIMLWGGQTKPHSDAQEDAWRKILSFLQYNLYCSPTLKAKM
ncbi:peroxisomal succinyl-coenzyme A thioesterase-like isoform X1 [Micropterus dolomieu]|uniref:peroxisomal succinyl-coenzyme A thioesterase-like isoform X1 n=1 Tax=Micropterus dolomieu TaxID=147949 RepID=UPI001E8E6CD0|nr:peroxisomal succinyl-coenzyme A thioesterase-like isoform X1 [Micropterus dolomieu]